MTIKLMQHQADGVALCGERPRYAFFYGCGTGKTLMMLAALHAGKAASRAMSDAVQAGLECTAAISHDTTRGKRFIEAPPYLKTVVVCPKAIMWNAWERDAEHYPGLNVEVCWDTTPAKRTARIQKPSVDVSVINFEAFKKHRRDLYDAGVRRLIIDESSKIKNPQSQISKSAIEFADYMQSVYVLSGTPAPNNGTEYWPQMRCVDKRVFDESFYRFAHRYFIPNKRTIRGKTVVTGWRENPQRRDEFIQRLASRSQSLRKEDAVDLPERVDVVREIELSPSERRAYDEIDVMLRTETASGETLSVRAESLAGKLRQLCGGWVYDDGGVEVFGSSKLDALADIVGDEIAGEQVVVWADFKHDLTMIGGMLGKLGVPYETLDGDFRGSSRDVIQRFQDGELRALVCHPASVGHGVTLTAASYAVFFSTPWSYELYQQARDRIHRTGQVNRCTYFHLLAADTVDRSVLWAVRNKGKKQDAIMRELRR